MTNDIPQFLFISHVLKDIENDSEQDERDCEFLLERGNVEYD
jgi:hypothetical protein